MSGRRFLATLPGAGLIGTRMDGLWPTPAELSACRLSLLVAVVAVAGCLPFALALGWLLARRRFPGKALVEVAVNLPLVLPPVVTGYLLLVAFGRASPIGRGLEDWLGLRVVFSFAGAALASAVVSFPLMLRAIRVAIESVDTRLEQAARTLGAGPFDTVMSVTLPLSRLGIIAGVLLGFARSMGEFGATIAIAGNIPGETRTIPLAIYTLIQTPGGAGGSVRLVLLSIAVAAGALAAGDWLERRGQARRRAT